jgi:hypothetical protein
LILNADRITTIIVGDSNGSDVHLALSQDLVFGQIGFMFVTRMKLHAAIHEPFVDRFGLLFAGLLSLVIQS